MQLIKQIMMQYQQNDKSFIDTTKSNTNYLIKHFHWADKKYSHICRKHKIFIPKLLEKQVVGWYHNILCHPGEACSELSIASPTFLSQNLRKTVHEVCSECKACQFLKRNKKQYRKLPSSRRKQKVNLRIYYV